MKILCLAKADCCKLIGIKDLTTFAGRVPGFASGMKAYAAEISGFSSSVTQTDIDNSTNAAKALIALEGSLSGEGGLLQNIMGVKSYDFLCQNRALPPV